MEHDNPELDYRMDLKKMGTYLNNGLNGFIDFRSAFTEIKNTFNHAKEISPENILDQFTRDRNIQAVESIITICSENPYTNNKEKVMKRILISLKPIIQQIETTYT